MSMLLCIELSIEADFVEYGSMRRNQVELVCCPFEYKNPLDISVGPKAITFRSLELLWHNPTFCSTQLHTEFYLTATRAEANIFSSFPQSESEYQTSDCAIYFSPVFIIERLDPLCEFHGGWTRKLRPLKALARYLRDKRVTMIKAFTIMSRSTTALKRSANLPATEALEESIRTLDCSPSFSMAKRRRVEMREASSERRNSLRPSDTFDITDLSFEADKLDSTSFFPSIEWNFTEESTETAKDFEQNNTLLRFSLGTEGAIGGGSINRLVRSPRGLGELCKLKMPTQEDRLKMNEFPKPLRSVPL